MEGNDTSSSVRNDVRDAWQECLRLMNIIRGENNGELDIRDGKNNSDNAIDCNKWNREHVRIWRQEIYDFLIRRHQYINNNTSNILETNSNHVSSHNRDENDWKREEDKHIGEFLLSLFYMNGNKYINISDVEQQDWVEQFLPFFLHQLQDKNLNTKIWNRYVLPSVQRDDDLKEEESIEVFRKRRKNILLTVMRLFSTQQICIMSIAGDGIIIKNKLQKEWVKLWNEDNRYSEHDMEWAALLLTCCSLNPLDDHDLRWWDDCLWHFTSLQTRSTHSKSCLSVCSSIQSTVPTMSLTTLMRIVEHPSSPKKQNNHYNNDSPILLLWIWQSLMQNFSMVRSILVPTLHQNNYNHPTKKKTNKKKGSNLYDDLLYAIQQALLFQLPWNSYAREIECEQKDITIPQNNHINLYYLWMDQLTSFSKNESHNFNKNDNIADNANQLMLWMQSFALFGFSESTGLQFSHININTNENGNDYEYPPNVPFINPILSIYCKWIQKTLSQGQALQQKEHITHLWIQWTLSSDGNGEKKSISNLLYWIQSMAILGTLWQHVPSCRSILLQTFVLEPLLQQSTTVLHTNRINKDSQYSHMRAIIWLQIFVQLSLNSNDNQKLFQPLYQQVFSPNLIIPSRVIVALCRVIDWNVDSYADIILPYLQKKTKQQPLHTLHCLSLILKKKTTVAINSQAVHLVLQIFSPFNNNEKTTNTGYKILLSNWQNYNSWTQQYLQIIFLATWLKYFFSLQKIQDPRPLFQFLVKILLYSPIKQYSAPEIIGVDHLDIKDFCLDSIHEKNADRYKPEKQHEVCRKMFWFTFNIICRDLNLDIHEQEQLQNRSNDTSLEKIQNQCQRWIPYLLECTKYYRNFDTKNNFSPNPFFENMQSKTVSKATSKERWSKFLSYLAAPCTDTVLSMSMKTTYSCRKNVPNSIFVLMDYKRSWANKSNFVKFISHQLSFFDKDEAFIAFFKCSKTYLLSISIAPGGSFVTPNEMDYLLKAIISQCSNFQEYYSRVQPKFSLNLAKDLISSFWEFHQSICNEESSSRFLTYLEETLIKNQDSNVKSLRRSTECNSIENFSIFSIQKSDDVDTFIRQFRLKILSSLDCIVSKYQSVIDAYRYEMILRQDLNEFLNDWAQIISCLCQDLFSGLNGGDSGGITRVMFKEYLTIVDKCIRIISAIVNEPSIILYRLKNYKSGYMKLLKICDDASQSIWRTLCKFQLRNSAIFKSSMILCLCHIPKLRRRLTQLWLFLDINVELYGDGMEEESESITTFTTSTFRRCNDYIQKWYQHNKHDDHIFRQRPLEININERSISPIDKEVDEHLVNDSNNNCLQNQEPQQCGQKQRNITLQLGNCEVWSWACSCSLQSAELIWIEVTLFMQRTNNRHNIPFRERIKPHNTIESDKFETKIISYAHRRMSELRRILESVCLFFEPLHVTGTDQNLKSNSPIGAELLSSNCKSRLCAVLERVAIALKTSLKYLELYVTDLHSKGAAVFKSNKLYKNNNYLNQSCEFAFVESVACLLSWIYNPKKNFTTQTRKWYAIEKLRNIKFKDKTQNIQYHDDPILTRMPKVLLRIEEMERQLQKFHKCLAKSNQEKKCKTVLEKLNDYCKKIGTVNINDKDGRQTRGNLYQNLTEFIFLVNENEADIYEFSSPASTKTNSSSDMISDSETTYNIKGVKRSTKLRTQKKLKRLRENVPRSRNDVVDNWLRLDSVFNKEDDAEYDTFADLEDFIEEG